MTRKEFLAQRAIADHIRKQGVTRVEPGKALGTESKTYNHKHGKVCQRPNPDTPTVLNREWRVKF
jgi:hypothetical protein